MLDECPRGALVRQMVRQQVAGLLSDFGVVVVAQTCSDDRHHVHTNRLRLAAITRKRVQGMPSHPWHFIPDKCLHKHQY